MKNIVLVIVILCALLGCHRNKRYLLEIAAYNRNYLGKWEIEVENDTLYKANDSDAYIAALTKYYAAKIAEAKYTGNLSRTRAFRISDDKGYDLTLKFSQKVTDSLTDLIMKIPDINALKDK